MMHCVLFDIDGTLLDSGGAGKVAMERALAEVVGELPPSAPAVSMAGRTDRAIATEILARGGRELGASDWRAVLDRYDAHLPGCLRAARGRVLPGVRALLGALEERDDSCLGLLTGNVERGAWCKLAHYGLDGYFSFGGFGDRHEDRDEVAREALSRACEHSGVARFATVWVIGDTPADVRCGRAIGATVVAVGTGRHTVEDLAECAPDHLFESFAAPEGFVRLLG